MDPQVLVPVVIKAPNQKIDDLLVKCYSNWTVGELKSHLSQVYPSKPHPNGQKLIYSGKLLLDNMVVTEVLKSYNGQQNNTIHLVCSLTRDNTYFENTSKPNTAESSNKNATEPTTERSALSGDNEVQVNSYAVLKQPSSSPVKDYRHVYSERAYLMNSYMQYISQHVHWSAINNPPQFFMNNEEPQENIGNNINNQLDNDANVNEEERHAHRDWLDWVYIVSRVIVLFTVVYFYSSPLRCFMVTGMALVLYHLGMFRLRQPPFNYIFNNFNNNNNNNNNNANEHEHVEEEEDNTPNNRVAPTNFTERFGLIKVVVHFVVSFLLSLVPDNRDN